MGMPLSPAMTSDCATILETVLNASPSMVSYISRDYRYLYVNPSYEDWFGISHAELVGRTLAEALGANVFAAAKPALDLAFAGSKQGIEQHLTDRRGNNCLVTTAYTPHRDASSNVIGVIAIMSDGSHLKHNLDRSERFLHMVADHIPGTVGYWSAELRCCFANKAYLEWFGRTHEQMYGMSLRDLVDEDFFRANEPFIQAALAGNAQSFERMVTKSNGSKIYTWAHYVPDVQDGKVEGFFVVATDITPLKLAQAELLRDRASLVAAAKMSSVGEMAAGVAHEINNPLMILYGKSEQLLKLLKMGEIDVQRFSDSLLMINQTAERIAKIVKGLRAFSRNAEGDPMQAVQLEHVVQDTLDLCAEKFAYGGIDLRYHPHAAVEIRCRSVQIGQVLLNLLLNALDAVADLTERWVDIDVAVVGDQVALTVTDSGLGIPLEIAERMMEPFYTTKDVGKGTGLGLSIAAGIMKDHGGELRYDASCANTRFICTLPLAGVSVKAA